MTNRVIRLATGETVLVSRPVKTRMQAVMSGVLELTDGYLRLRDGDSCNVVLLPEDAHVIEGDSGPVFIMLNTELRPGDRVISAGGTVPASASGAPEDSGLLPTTLVDVLQDDHLLP